MREEILYIHAFEHYTKAVLHFVHISVPVRIPTEYMTSSNTSDRDDRLYTNN